MNEFLQKIITNKTAMVKELRKKIKESQDADEVRALGDTLQSVLDELNDAKEKLDELEDEGEGGQEGQEGESSEGEERGKDFSKETRGKFNPIESYSQSNGKKEERNTDPYDTVEYRTAFMNYVCRNTPIPKEVIPTEVRSNSITTTTDAGAVIPTSILNEIITELKSYGNIYNKVRKLNIQGGVQVPILSLKPTASWIGETTTSDDQKIQAKDKISFNYYGLECKIAQTLLVNVTTLAMFQELFVPLAVEAMTIALEKAVINGTGSGQPTGILTDTRVPSKNVITLVPDDITSWSAWKKKVFAKMKKAYRNGEFFMAQGTFDGYIDGMVDKQGQPIGRVNYGIDGGETYRFGGKNVETVEDDIIAAYDDASTGDVIAVFVNLSDYAINSNLDMQTVKWIDHDTNEIKNKCILICDGKLLDPNGVLVIKKGAAPTPSTDQKNN